MSNITKNLNIYKDVTNLIGARSFGKEDLVVPYRQLNGTKDGDAYILPAYTVGNYSWEFNVKIRLSESDISGEFKISDTPVDLKGFRLSVVDGKFSLLVSIGSLWAVYSGFSGIYDVIPNTTYWIKVGFNAATNEYYLSYSLDNVTFTKDISYTSSDKHVPYTPQKLFIKAIKKIEYLEDCYMIVNGVEVWRVIERTSTISRDDMQNYVLDGVTVTQPVLGDSKAVIDFSNVKLPWRFEYSDRLQTSRFAIAPYGTTVTQPRYVKDVNGTKVGSPTVDENYVVTNFSNSQYISTTPFTFNDATDTFKVDTYVKLSSLPNYTFIFTASSTSRGAATQNSMWKTNSSNGNQTGGSVATNRWYHLVLEQTGDSSVLYVDGQAVINAGKCFNSGDYINFGKSYWEPFYNGFIDFSQTSIQINGEEVWSGTHWVATDEMETLQGCIRYYFGYKPDAVLPPEDSSNTYNIYAVNGDEGIVLDSKWYDYGGLTTRPVLGDGPVPTFEKEWYLGEYRVETGEEGSPYSPDGGYFQGGGIVLS